MINLSLSRLIFFNREDTRSCAKKEDHKEFVDKKFLKVRDR